jgi:hypothetical protein
MLGSVPRATSVLPGGWRQSRRERSLPGTWCKTTFSAASLTSAPSAMFTVLACLFALFAADGFFRKRTLNDDSWTAEAAAHKPPGPLARLKPVLWIGLAIVSLFVAWQFEW